MCQIVRGIKDATTTKPISTIFAATMAATANAATTTVEPTTTTISTATVSTATTVPTTEEEITQRLIYRTRSDTCSCSGWLYWRCSHGECWWTGCATGIKPDINTGSTTANNAT